MSWSLDMRILSALGAALAFVPSGADARRSQQIDDVASFRRPVLPAGADTNSWIAYYNYGVAHLRTSPEDAEAGFVWATRIDPTRSQPLYARWITFWRRNMGLYKKYLNHDRRLLESPLILRVDSFYVRAQLRNPFTPLDLDLILQERLAWTTSNWARDSYTQGFVNYAAGNYVAATYHFERLVTKDPVEYSDVRRLLALCYIATHRLDKAVEQTVAFLAEQRRRSATYTVRVYQSQEVLLYGLGALHRILGDTAAARQDLSQSLTENIAFFPAHAELADIALEAGDTAQAIAEYSLAVELAPDDGVLHYRYARVLSTVGGLADAESELRRAIQLEPFFAPPYLGLALVLETRGNAAEAAEQYRGYLARTNRGDPRIEMARARLAALAP
jgi:tetratricopeptide (TPR) repeat protein